MRARRLIVLFLIVTVASLGTTSSQLAAHSFSPITDATTIPILQGTTQPINITFGNQTNPSVACNLATYTEDDFQGTSQIKYFDFATNAVHAITGGIGQDRLADTDGRRIAFTRIVVDEDPVGDHVAVYDIASQTVTPIPGGLNSDPSIGGNLVAFLHANGAPPENWEIGVYDQNTGNVTQLTNDTLRDWLPAVSPDGNVVVWQKCQPNNTGCDIYSATQTGPGAFTTRLLTGAGEDHHPDTNGQLVVYISDKTGENDIYLQQAGGSSEMHLAIPGDQRDVRISGNLLAFESQMSTGYEVVVYDLSTARLYQVTNTPGVDETLTDIATGCDGINRIVYAKPGPTGDFDVWGFEFRLNDSLADQLSDLIALVQSFNLHDGTEASLITKLQDALAAVNNSDTATACDSLTAFINASQAQSGKKLTADQVRQLVDSAVQIKSDLGCQ